MFVIVTLTFVMVRGTSILFVISEVVVLLSRTERSCSCVNSLIDMVVTFALLF